MADVLTSEQRRKCMAAIKGKDSKPEMIVRKMAHALGFRYRLHDKNLPGKPDLVFKKQRKVILVHGCFWHRHECSLGAPVPQTRPEFWKTKFQRNVQRDQENLTTLQEAGWDVLTIWECQTKSQFVDQLADVISDFMLQ